jgi:SAM-dependent methyltransferase
MILLLALIFIVPFGLVVLFGAPYVPAHKKGVDDALSFTKLSKDGRVLDLGCGDGKFLLAAAKKGLKCTGYEVNPFLYLVCKLRLRNYTNAEVKLSNFWKTDFPKDTEVVYVFLLDKFMLRLDEKMRAEAKRLGSFDKLRTTERRLSLVSYVFRIPGKKTVKEVDGVVLYSYNN